MRSLKEMWKLFLVVVRATMGGDWKREIRISIRQFAELIS
jgi:hypothetical protein